MDKSVSLTHSADTRDTLASLPLDCLSAYACLHILARSTAAGELKTHISG